MALSLNKHMSSRTLLTNGFLWLMQFTLAVVIAAVLSLFSAVHAAPSEWLLMSRHGECVEIGPTLSRKFENLPAIASPNWFIDVMRERGLTARESSAKEFGQGIVMIELPEAAITLIFARRERCDAVIDRQK